MVYNTILIEYWTKSMLTTARTPTLILQHQQSIRNGLVGAGESYLFEISHT